jgi:alpha-tubulin suppressor-like RCC1 family protein
MKIILSARGHHYVARVSIFFVTVALIIGMVGCDQSAPPVEPQYITQVAAGGYHTVGLKSDSTAVAVGDKRYGQCAVRLWRDIIQVATGCYHTVGLKDDGTVVAVGLNDDGQCDVGSWALN